MNDCSSPICRYPSLQTNSALSPTWKELLFPCCRGFKMAPTGECSRNRFCVEHVSLFAVKRRFVRGNEFPSRFSKLCTLVAAISMKNKAKKKRKPFIVSFVFGHENYTNQYITLQITFEYLTHMVGCQSTNFICKLKETVTYRLMQRSWLTSLDSLILYHRKVIKKSNIFFNYSQSSPA